LAENGLHVDYPLTEAAKQELHLQEGYRWRTKNIS
jgi:hypothetical protein